MTNIKQDPITCTSGDHKDWSLYFLEIEDEAEDLDREAGQDYLPMDVFLDRSTIEEHFQATSIRTRKTQIH